MRYALIAVTVAVTAVLSLATRAATDDQSGKPPHMMLCEYGAKNRIVELGADGSILWEHKVPSLAVMFEVRKNGNVIYAYGGNPTGVQEVDRNHNIVWNYTAPCEQVLTFELLPNNNILIGEQGPCKAVEVNRKGEVVREVSLTTAENAAHRQVRHVRKLKTGNILACHEADATVREVDATGKVVWEYSGCPNVFEAQRLPNGNTLISCGTDGRVIEVTPEKQIVWECGRKDFPDIGINWITSIQRKKNGNLVLANFTPGKDSGVFCFEVTRDKHLVWKFEDRKLVGVATCCMTFDK